IALILLLFGLNETITAINNELAVLPYFLTLIHGIVTHLNIPTALPHYLLAAGVVLVIPGIITLAKRKTL
ncbi:MAG: hypothetical protein NZL89_04265, partial [Leptospiraceae bacterium]|nr:hypothetical protein [Leptospiraceae bacterium]